MNATVLPEKQEERRNPRADGDGFMAQFLLCSSRVLVLIVLLSSELWQLHLPLQHLTCHCLSAEAEEQRSKKNSGVEPAG